MAITSTGLGSGLDVEGLVSKLVAAERDPVTKQIQTKGSAITAKVSALGQVSGALAAFQAAARSLETTSQYLTPVVSSSDSASISATASSAAKIQNHVISVSQLAQNQRLTTGSFATTDTVVGSGKLVIDFGKITKLDGTPATPNASGIYDNTDAKFTTNSTKGSVSITIDSQHNTLAGIQDAINASGAPVTASIVNDGSGYRLVLSSTDSGESNSMRITVSDDAGGSTDTTGLSQLAYDVTRAAGAGQNISQVQAGQSAKLNVDGIAVTTETNTPSNILSGITLNLLKTTTSPVNLSLGRDATSAAKGISAFAKAYNDLQKTLSDVSYYDAKTKSAGALQGESVIRTIQSQVRSVLNGVVPGGTFDSLNDVGISFEKDTGNMLFNQGVFSSAIQKDAASVASLFGSYGSATDNQVSYVSSGSGTKPGKYAISITQAATHGALTAGAAASSTTNIDLTATTNTLSFKIDGTNSGTITLAANNYATGGDLALELQSKINGDAALKAAGVSVSVSFDNTSGKFSITSNRYGSTSSVAVNTISSDLNTALGLSTSDAGVAGQDVAGTIGNAVATGSGQYLTGVGDAQGLKLLIDGSSAGSRGTVTYNRGFAMQLDDAISTLTAKTGALTGRQDSLNNSLDDLTKQLDKLSTRMDDLEKRYRAQFTALDVTISSLRNTSSFLSQQLAALPGASSS
ncbi:flagellar filament capping protein FliD [Chitinimonas sp.]|uniref:flagellar filament capping protein FliD n=1 Tax=Chitinimonas sp. TaxID=1934313 RepID=UPI002F9344D9